MVALVLVGATQVAYASSSFEVEVIASSQSTYAYDIYPTTVNTEINVSFQTPIDNELRVNVYNLFGQQVFTTTESGQSTHYTFDIGHLPQGRYFLQIEGDKEVHSFIKK